MPARSSGDRISGLTQLYCSKFVPRSTNSRTSQLAFQFAHFLQLWDA